MAKRIDEAVRLRIGGQDFYFGTKKVTEIPREVVNEIRSALEDTLPLETQLAAVFAAGIDEAKLEMKK